MDRINLINDLIHTYRARAQRLTNEALDDQTELTPNEYLRRLIQANTLECVVRDLASLNEWAETRCVFEHTLTGRIDDIDIDDALSSSDSIDPRMAQETPVEVGGNDHAN